MTPTWSWRPFYELSLDDLYAALRLRQEVFIVEQRCYYLDLDAYDQSCWHGLGRLPDGKLAAYARIIPPGFKFPGPCISRVVTAPEVRQQGLGRELMARAIAETRARFPGQAICIAAQAYLERFYAGFGFVATGRPYDEDGILHVDMIAPPSP